MEGVFMDNKLNNAKWSFIIMAIVFIVAGIILVAWPDVTTKIVCYGIGGAISIYGLLHLIAYFTKYKTVGYFQLDLLIGLLAAGVGLFMLFKSDVVISILPVILGITLFIESIIKLQRAMELKKAGYEGWRWILIIAGITVLLAVLLFFNPFEATSAMAIFIGICMIYNGISELWTIYCMTTYLKDRVDVVEVVEVE